MVALEEEGGREKEREIEIVLMSTQEKMVTCQPRRFSPEPDQAGTLMSDF